VRRVRAGGPARWVVLCASTLLWAGATFAPSLGAQSRDEAVGRASLSAGLYSKAQADRGAEEYRNACAHCHATDLLGDVRQEIPSLAESDFMVRWGGRPLGRLFAMIRTDMPADRPGQLPARAYGDILAYILEVNGFPAGTQDLPADEERLDAIAIEPM